MRVDADVVIFFCYIISATEIFTCFIRQAQIFAGGLDFLFNKGYSYVRNRNRNR